MALKRIVTPEEYKKLSKELQGEYKESEGAFTLDLTDYEDPAELRTAKEHEKKARKTAEAALKEAQTALATLTDERDGMLAGSIPKADAEKLQKSWEKKFADREKELNGQIATAHANLQTMLVDNVATQLATEISTAPKVIIPHIKSRLRAEQVDGVFVTKIVDAEGKPSALTVAELKKEFLANKDFSPVLIGSKGSGGGAGGSGGGGGAGSGGGSKIDFKGTPAEIAARIKASGKIAME